MNYSDTDPGPRVEVSTAMHSNRPLLRAIYFHGLAHATVKVAYMVALRFPSLPPSSLNKIRFDDYGGTRYFVPAAVAIVVVALTIWSRVTINR
jgi:hypothetical protein